MLYIRVGKHNFCVSRPLTEGNCLPQLPPQKGHLPEMEGGLLYLSLETPAVGYQKEGRSERSAWRKRKRRPEERPIGELQIRDKGRRPPLSPWHQERSAGRLEKTRARVPNRTSRRTTVSDSVGESRPPRELTALERRVIGLMPTRAGTMRNGGPRRPR